MSNTIVLRTAGQQMPSDYQKTLLEKHPAGFGLMVAMDGQVFVTHVPGDEFALDEGLAKCEKEYKDHKVAYCFWGDKEVPAESRQPFVLIKDGDGEEDKIHLACMLDAELPTFKNEDGENYSSEYLFVHQLLIGVKEGSKDDPLMADLIGLTDGNIELIMKLLAREKNEQQQAIKTALGDKGMCLLMASNSETLGVVSNLKAEEYPWGVTTRTHGFGDPKGKGKSALSLSLKPKSQEEKKEEPKKEEKKEGGTEVDPKVEFARLLTTNSSFYLVDGKILTWRPEPGTKLQAAKSAWQRNTELPIPKGKDDIVDAKALYAGFPVANLKPSAPAQDALDRFYGKKKEPKEAESIQGPSEPKAEDKKPQPFAYLIPGNDKKSYLGLKTEGRLPMMTDAELGESLKDNPVASIQLDESFDNDLAKLSPLAFGRLSGHLRTALWHETRCRYLGLIQSKAPAEKTAAKPSLSLKKTG